MLHLDTNWISIILATLASMALGMAWYMILAKQWVKATGKNKDDLMAGGSSAPFIWAAIAQLIMAFFIYQITKIIFDGTIDIKNTVLIGVHLWFGFILTSMTINHRYQNMSWKLTLIDGGYMLGVVVVQGVMIGLFA